MSLKPPPPPVEALESLAYEAFANGGEFPSGWIEASGAYTRNLRHAHWDIAGDCQRPVRLTLSSRHSRRWRVTRERMTVTLEARCRQCPACLRKRAALWRYRAIGEIAAAERTWFGTLTFRPEEHYRMEISARAGAKPAASDSQALGAWRRAQIREAGKELTKFFKRVRKNTGLPMRYLAVAELHLSSKTSDVMRERPHYHLLIHEQAGCPIPWKALDREWTLGHSKFKLVSDTRGAMYVCKYISKEAGARIRASQNYGNAL